MIGWRDGDGVLHQGSLFAVFAALSRGEAWSFPALRPHQREPWHAFTVQVAALALIRAGLDATPESEGAWRDLLLALTPEWPGGEAWELVVNDWSKPALLQPPVTDSAFRKEREEPIRTADRLDMLVISRNHEIKRERLLAASEEEWLFALVTLQTTEGRMGAGRNGISRMNSGYGTRMTMGIRSTTRGAAGAFGRDVRRLVADARGRRDRRTGLALLWLPPWDGKQWLDYSGLDELYVEICRRVRLRHVSEGIEALTAGTERTRVAAKALGGNTRDPWAPLTIDTNKTRDTFGKPISVTPGGEGFGYRQIAQLLDRERTTLPLLARLHEEDDRDGLSIVAAALVRGQGKTEGLHRRAIRTSRIEELEEYGPVEVLDRVGYVAKRRADDAWEAGRHLRRALIVLMSGGKERDDLVRARDRDAEAWTAALRDYDTAVDRDFFGADLWAEVAASGSGRHRRPWRQRLRAITEETLAQATNAAPRSSMRREEAAARAENKLAYLMDHWMKELTGDDLA